MYRPFLLGLVTLLLAFTVTSYAQQAQCLQRSIPVYVSSSDGHLPVELTPAHFAATYQDKPLRVTAVSPEQHPQRLIVLLDASGSIRGGTTAGWEATVEAAAQLI